jgi:putative sugar O-methyltransferase
MNVVATTPDLPTEFFSALVTAHEAIHQNPYYRCLPFGISVLDLCETAFRIAELNGQLNGATPLADMEISLAGSPAFYFKLKGKTFSDQFLRYYMRYAYCCKYIDFSKVDTVVEIGGGVGKFAEVLKKAHPHLSFYLLEIAPQSYICHQYLRGVLGNDVVVPYSETRLDKAIEVPPGKIAVLGNWQIEHIRPQGRVLFVNMASFQEMESEIVENYLNLIKPYSQAVYLLQSVSGIPLNKDKEGGEIKSVQMNNYQALLDDTFTMVSEEVAYDPLRVISDLATNYHNMIWLNKEHCEIAKIAK